MRFLPRLRTVLPALAAAVLCAPSPGAAQEVNATSGDPALVAAVRTQVAEIDRALPRYRRETRAVRGFSAKDGRLEAFFDEGGQLRKIEATHFGEMWRGTEEYYYADGRLVFVATVHERHAGRRGMSNFMRRTSAPLHATRANPVRDTWAADGTGPSRQRTNTRYFFDADQLVRRERSYHPQVSPRQALADQAWFDPIENFGERSAWLAACAAAEGPCAAPQSVLENL
ncbi:MAG TPA: hypothetical protein VHG91_15860 [Longimicrobium sp.]|nr:hypothetical protein [Longimicrobium sp.]